MHEFYTLHDTGTALRIVINQPEDIDLGVISQGESDGFALGMGLFQGGRIIEYSLEEFLTLEECLDGLHFTRAEALRFLYGLYTSLDAAMQSQPVLLDSRAILTNSYGSQFELLRIPLRFECWMKREEDRQGFHDQLLERFPADDLEVCGLLFMGARENLSFFEMSHRIEQLCRKTAGLLRHKTGIAPYRARHPLSVPVRTPSAGDSSALQNEFPCWPGDGMTNALMVCEGKTPFTDLWSQSEMEVLKEPFLEGRSGQTPQAGSLPEEGVKTLLLEDCLKKAWIDLGDQHLFLHTSPATAGRQEGCDLLLSHPSVSFRHARLVQKDCKWYVQDLHSTNGTWLNEKRVVRQMRLKEGMHIRFGQVEGVFHE